MAFKNFPVSQGTQSVRKLLESVPGLHTLHSVSFVLPKRAVTVPVGQDVHVVDSVRSVLFDHFHAAQG